MSDLKIKLVKNKGNLKPSDHTVIDKMIDINPNLKKLIRKFDLQITKISKYQDK